jgi:hypothetical protein
VAFSAGGDDGRDRLNFRQRKVICDRKKIVEQLGHSCRMISNGCEEEAQLRLISKLRGLYRKAFPASCHVI